MLLSEESLLEAREELSRRKEGVSQEDTGNKGIPFEMGCSLIPVSLLQVYIVLTSGGKQVICICLEVFLQRLHST